VGTAVAQVSARQDNIELDFISGDPTAVVNFETAPGVRPEAIDDSASTANYTPVVIDVLANDTAADGRLVASSVIVSVPPENGTIEVRGDGTVLYQPANGFSGVDSFQYTVADDNGLVSLSAEVTITVVSTPSVWRNPIDRYDVDADGRVAPVDVILIVNRINLYGSGAILSLADQGATQPFIDVNGDWHLSPVDALQIINFMNRQTGEAEGESGRQRDAVSRIVAHEFKLSTWGRSSTRQETWGRFSTCQETWGRFSTCQELVTSWQVKNLPHYSITSQVRNNFVSFSFF
jgi:hypothetical protein